MKKLVLAVIFAVGCSIVKGDNKQDAGVKKATPNEMALYIKYKKDKVRFLYLPHCMAVCYRQIGEEDACMVKCEGDLIKIYNVMTKAIHDGREDDFDDMIEHWY